MGESLSEGELTKQQLAVKALKEQRQKRYSIYQNLLDTKAERDRFRSERLARGT